MNIHEMTTEEIIAHLQTRFFAIVFAGAKDDMVKDSGIDEVAMGYAGDMRDVTLLVARLAEQVGEELR